MTFLHNNSGSEIILRDRQFCNLTEVVVRADDKFSDLARKAKMATILGTLQATLTDFRYLSRKWKDNCEEERLLGVSLTGIMDHPILSGKIYPEHMNSWWDGPMQLEDTLEQLKEVVIGTNKEWADRLGINQSTAVSCVNV